MNRLTATHWVLNVILAFYCLFKGEQRARLVSLLPHFINGDSTAGAASWFLLFMSTFISNVICSLKRQKFSHFWKCGNKFPFLSLPLSFPKAFHLRAVSLCTLCIEANLIVCLMEQSISVEGQGDTQHYHVRRLMLYQ